MARTATPPGPASQAVAWNVQRRRAELRITAADLVQRLADLGREVHRSWVSEVETGRRRVDTDDLVQLAAALGVSPATLLMPQSLVAEDVVETPIGQRDARDYWEFLTTQRSAASTWIEAETAETRLDREHFLAAARPRWVS
ncbi:hypothetical protein TPB0596_04760 [Tsukamurella pulmonis]|uniref:helix-turn-helix domain-containing protein n=1 Tax=Tsukamurella pulmonis TaxID=47312 RepID=UPI001EDEE58E|nr:helix-turn-helix transcriptional regulator [Tsukamurella pulmonis]BDD80713.1 hypothetical protein TPB0596_04760 [Tsukamurella pulmonis]